MRDFYRWENIARYFNLSLNGARHLLRTLNMQGCDYVTMIMQTVIACAPSY